MGRAPLSATGTTGAVRVVAVGGATSARGSFDARPELADPGLDVGFTGTFFGAGAGFATATGLVAAGFAAGLGAAGFGADFVAGAAFAFGAGFATTLRFAAAGFGAAFFTAGFLAFAGLAGLFAGNFAGIYDSICRSRSGARL